MDRITVILVVLAACCLQGAGADKAAKRIICNKQADILLIVDRAAGRLNSGEQEEMKRFWLDLAGLVNAGLNDSRVAVISAGKEAHVEERFDTCDTNDLPCILDPIKNITFEQNSNDFDLLGALTLAKNEIFVQKNGDRRGKGNAIIIASNNIPVDLPAEVSKAALAFRRLDSNIYLATVEAGGRKCSHMDKDGELVEGDPAYDELVSDPNYKHCMSVSNVAKLKTKTYKIMKDVCNSVNVGRAFIPPIISPGEVCFIKADVTLLIDRSGSIIDGGKWEEWVRMRHFISDIINRFQVGLSDTRVAIVSFGNRPYTRKHIDLDDCATKECLHEVLWSIDSPNGQTATLRAFEIAAEEIYVPSGGDRKNALDIITLITDGKPYPPQPDLLAMVDRLKFNENMKILGVGVTHDVDFHMMEQIVSYPYKEYYFQSDNFNTLLSEVEGLQSQACQVSTPGPLPIVECNADIALVIDRSGSITEFAPFDENWYQLKEFLYGLVDSVQIGRDATQIALVPFSDKVQLALQLNTCNNKACIKRAIGNMGHPEGATHTTEALSVVNDHVFSPNAGDRRNYKNIIILVTDGLPSPYVRAHFDQVVNKAKKAGTTIYGIGVTRNVSMEIMQGMVSSPWSEHYYPVEMFTNLGKKDFYYGIITRACSQPGPQTTPMMTPAPPTALPASDCIRDVAILVDRSEHILSGNGLDNWDRLREFLVRFITALDVGPSRTRVAIVSFNGASRPELQFSRCSDDQCVKNTIYAMDAPGGRRSFKSAFQVTRDFILKPQYGDRDYVPDTVVLVTVGRPFPDEPKIVSVVEREIKSKNIKVLGVGITDRVDSFLMRQLVSSPAEYNYISVGSFENLHNIIPTLKVETCRVEDLPTVKPVICGADIHIILDRSGSIVDPPRRMLNWDDLRTFVLRLIDTIDVGPTASRVALTYFANEVHTKAYLNDCRDRDCLKQKVWTIPDPFGETNTAGALMESNNVIFSPGRGDRPNPDIIILITDGKPNPYNEGALRNVLTKLNNRHITIYGIGVTDNVNTPIMQYIVSQPWQNHYYSVESFNALNMNTLYEIIMTRACGGTLPIQPVPGPTSSPSNPIGECNHDILLMADRSQSVTSRGETYAWDYIKRYLKSIVDTLELGKGTTRLSLMDFSDKVTMQFYLSGCDSGNKPIKECMYDRIDGMTIPHGGTKLGAAFDVAKEYVFTRERGARDNSNKVILLLTDGIEISQRVAESATADATRFKNMGYRIIVVAIGNDINERLFTDIASEPLSQNFIKLPSYASLNSNHNRIMSQTCSNDFRSTGSNNPVEPVFLSACVAGVDLIVAVDTSTQQFDEIPEWLTSLLRELPISQGLVKVGIVTYADKVSIIKNLADQMGINAIGNRLRNTRYTPEQDSNTADVLNRISSVMLTTRNGDRADRHNVVLLIVGKASPFRSQTISVGRQLKDKAKILSVGVGSSVDEVELGEISTDQPYYVNSVDLMPKGVLLNKMCSAGPSLKCDNMVDLAFIVDPRMTESEEEFNKVKQFLVKVVTSYQGGQDGSHFALVTVGRFTRVLFGLEQHDFRSHVVTTIQDELAAESFGQPSNLALGLELAENEVFFRGARTDAKQVVLIVSNGEPSVNPYRAQSEARRMKGEGIELAVVTVSQGFGLFELEEIASPAEGGGVKLVASESYDNLQSVVGDVVAHAC